ncbi:bestrophin family protein [Pontibacter vulgaris]|uniref:bestrophin family protein n=1 Tax=Pontibacter vulgaris TaxID=2905679 RepID=UPI001FA6E134|nr:bestrophin family ion channel [Pontibacter vulgaris]
MIIRPKHNWLRMLFVWRGSVLQQIYPRLLLLGLLSLVVVYFRGELFHYKIPLNPAPFTLIGVALAIFLGFRNNAGYERFWEGRKLWGALLNYTRSLARQATTMSGLPVQSEQVSYFINLLIAFTYALKHQLRETDPTPDFERLLPPELTQRVQPAKYKPIMLLQEMGNWVQQRKKEDLLDSITVTAIDQNFNELSNIVGGCERIASTPIPYPYNLLLHRTVYIYCFLLPFGLVDSIGWMTPLFVIFVAYTFMALDTIINEIEEPFGTEANDLALNALSRMIETTLLEMIGKKAPEFPQNPQAYIAD